MSSRQDSNQLLWRFFWRADAKVTEEDIIYFRNHPDQIEEITAPINMHKFFLGVGMLLGTLCVALSKFFKFTDVLYFMPKAVREFCVDFVFELGVALIGGAVVAYILGISLNNQLETGKKWRSDIRKKISDDESLADKDKVLKNDK